MSLPFAVLISGRGSNMLALAQAVRDGRIDGGIVAVISDRADAAGLASAQALGLPTAVVAPEAGEDRGRYGKRLAAAIDAAGAKLVVLAGFMRILDGSFVRAFEGRLLNIHPSLLPKYRGLHTHRRVIEAGERNHGCTVHFVTEELDAGPAIVQGRLETLPGEDEQALSARVQRLEHIIYPKAVAWFADGRLALKDGVVLHDGRAADPALVELMA